ncbi:MAG TPA: bifunctional transaldolase/phosoglucose isomerase [Pyrinomonadaceae bacterium]|nr:bifunctional transaldolase/phosoglucose isomerase [Pyrinomonadaceae bacterium]
MSLNSQTANLPDDLAQAVAATLADWQTNNKIQRLWSGDASVWTDTDENKWLGWLNITSQQLAELDHLTAVAADIKSAGFSHALLLGMGGSSLCPEVLSLTFGKIPGFPELHVLDSTDPAQVKTRENEIDLTNTIFIVSSKSGGTLEPNIFKQYFFERTKVAVGEAEAGRRFIAITDPGSKMQQVAEQDQFRRILFGRADIGGRYSALSDFGMIPAAIMGLDVKRFLEATAEMVEACKSSSDNPGLALGAILGTAADPRFKRDKITIITSPGVHDLGAWLEQLLAESTGKDGLGLIPVDRERLAPPQTYGDDRVFVYLHLAGTAESEQDDAVVALERAGHPMVRIEIEETYQLGQEFFRWEIATAVAGAILQVNPFDQPDVEASKVATRELTSAYEQSGKLPEETPFFADDDLKLFTDDRNLAELKLPEQPSLVQILKAHLTRLTADDYFAVLAYIEMNEEHEASLQELRHAVRDRTGIATCLGFGPRFLHSTGQAYKGGPNSGVFLQITCDDARDLPVPDQKYTFGIVKAAQARGDFKVLLDRQRRALRVHLGIEVKAGLEKLSAAVMSALGYELGKAFYDNVK